MATPIRRLGALLALAGAAAACSEQPTTPAARPQYEIIDASHGAGNAHVYFLPPMVASPSWSGAFDPTANVEVRICALSGANACAEEIARFTMTSGKGSERVRLDAAAEQYIVTWHTRDFALDPAKTYRIRVLVGGLELVHADVDVVASGNELKRVDTGAYVALKKDGTLPIKVRVEEGAVLAARGSPFALGHLHTCAIDVHGTAYCWGLDDYGELGDGAMRQRPSIQRSPVRVAGSHTFTQVVAGADHSCGLDTDGHAWCWGYNASGTLGNGSYAPATAPVAVSGGQLFTWLTANEYHTCGLTADGSAYCWGANGVGQLGDGTRINRNVPTPVSGGLRFREISAGGSFTCGIVTSGGVSCWGDNRLGQLGSAPSDPTATPQPVIAGTASATSIAGGAIHACALLADMSGLCWGWNATNVLGHGLTETVEEPGKVNGGHAFVSISTGDNHSCGLDAGGQAWCWGANAHGALGIGSFWPVGSAIPLQVRGGPWSSIRAGGFVTCGVLLDGTGQCWGMNIEGAVGIGSTANFVTTPTTLEGLVFPTGP